jgi:2-polyprenyl-6-methoxyphenol 4-hydroxylase
LLANKDPDLRIMVVEPNAIPLEDNSGEPVYQPSYDARASALSAGSVNIFSEMGLWPVLSRHAEAISQVHVSDRGHPAGTLLDSSHDQITDQGSLGYVVENHWLGKVLLRHLLACRSIDLQMPASVTEIKPIKKGCRVSVDLSENNIEHYTAQLIVVADGAQSALREKLGIAIEASEYLQSAIIANITLSQPHRGIAYERFTDQGPIALLPLIDRTSLEKNQASCRVALVWTHPLQDIDSVMALSDDDFLLTLQKAFGYRAGEFVAVGRRNCYPLKLAIAKEQVRSGIVLMGNAAHSLHPVAGQGFNLALRDAAALADILATANRAQQWLGNLSVLKQYPRSQQWDQDKTVGFSHLLTKLFSNNDAALTAARNFGLLAMDLLPSVKQEFTRHAAGLAARYPDITSIEDRKVNGR